MAGPKLNIFARSRPSRTSIVTEPKGDDGVACARILRGCWQLGQMAYVAWQRRAQMQEQSNHSDIGAVLFWITFWITMVRYSKLVDQGSSSAREFKLRWRRGVRRCGFLMFRQYSSMEQSSSMRKECVFAAWLFAAMAAIYLGARLALHHGFAHGSYAGASNFSIRQLRRSCPFGAATLALADLLSSLLRSWAGHELIVKSQANGLGGKWKHIGETTRMAWPSGSLYQLTVTVKLMEELHHDPNHMVTISCVFFLDNPNLSSNLVISLLCLTRIGGVSRPQCRSGGRQWPVGRQ